MRVEGLETSGVGQALRLEALAVLPVAIPHRRSLGSTFDGRPRAPLTPCSALSRARGEGGGGYEE